ncbi:sulfatase-like hydrolase/transferase [Persicirhabdus sediminis]|nr:sulfatase-like hydrolase/transferase [Persicirhabdus sediminis]
MKAFSSGLIFLTMANLVLADRPNFIFMLADDQHYEGTSVQVHEDFPASKSQLHQTPHLAKLASQGMTFSAAYSPSSVCSPTRLSLQTGRNPAALGMTRAGPSLRESAGQMFVGAESRREILDDEITLGEVLQSAGYATAHFGKWHLGGGGPERHGYDVSDGDLGNEHAAKFAGDNPVDIVGMTERAVAFMQSQQLAKKPFFIQMSYHALHCPENASAKNKTKFAESGRKNGRRGLNAAITADLDDGVGALMQAVDGLGLAQTTYLIYMSDNGGSGGGRQLIRGSKGSVLEGGIRVPLVVAGPEIPAGSYASQRVVGYDFFPTICQLAGVDISAMEQLEGGDLRGILRGGDGPVKRADEFLVFHFPHYQATPPQSAIFLGDYKWIYDYQSKSGQLFHIAADMGEARDLSKSLPELAEKLQLQLDDYLTRVAAKMPQINPSYDPENVPAVPRGGGRLRLRRREKGEERRVKREG